MDYLKAFITKLQNLDHSRRTDTIFKDFLTLSTYYAIMQPFYRSPEIEQKYINIISKYNKEQANDFSQMLALLVNRLKIQLDEIDKLDKEFYEKADILLGFTDNAYEYFSKGNIKQKRKILEIISEEITFIY